MSGLIVKPFRVVVQGFGFWTYVAKSRGKALAKAFGDYTASYNSATFGDFLKIANASLATYHDRFGDPISVGGKPAFFVSNDNQYIQFVRPDSDVVLNSHPYDVLPVEYRPWTYRDRDSGRLPKGEDAGTAAECEASQSGPKGIAQPLDFPSEPQP